MASKYWIKLFHEILDDFKMATLSDRLYRRTIELFLMAGDYYQDGKLPEVEAIAWRLRLTNEELKEDLKVLCNVGIITQQDTEYAVTNFAERQAPMSDTERQRLHREKERKNMYYGLEPVTNRDNIASRNDNNSLVDIDKDIDKDTDIDIDTDLDSEKTASLFEQCQRICEKKKGLPVTDGASFTLMINNFKRAGVTADDYAAAIDAMDADGRYKASKPTSYENWAISYAEKRKNPVKRKKQNQEFDIDKIIEEIWND